MYEQRLPVYSVEDFNQNLQPIYASLAQQGLHFIRLTEAVKSFGHGNTWRLSR